MPTIRSEGNPQARTHDFPKERVGSPDAPEQLGKYAHECQLEDYQAYDVDSAFEIGTLSRLKQVGEDVGNPRELDQGIHHEKPGEKREGLHLGHPIHPNEADHRSLA